MRETASGRRQAPLNVTSSLDAARELGIRDAQAVRHAVRQRRTGMPSRWKTSGLSGSRRARRPPGPRQSVATWGEFAPPTSSSARARAG